MRKKRNRLLGILFSLSLGFFLIWLVIKGFTAIELQELQGVLARAEPGWLLLSAGLGVLSHVSRALRWRYTLHPIGVASSFWNRWFAVMVGYLVNLAIPRMGEVSRCAVLARYEEAPFDKALGTLITERAIDLLILLLLIGTFLIWQHSIVLSYLKRLPASQTQQGELLLALSSLLLIASITGGIFLKKSDHRIARKIRALLRGLVEGVRALAKVEHKWAFVVHTLLIWGLYLSMAYVCYFALAETSTVPLAGVLGAFVLGGISMVATQGGLGAYPIAIQQILLLYGIGATTGYAFGWLIWIAQTLMILTLGFASVIALPLVNRR